MVQSASTIQAQVHNILAERCQIITDLDNSDKPIHLDSMALMELIVGLENDFSIQLDNSKLEALYSACSLDSVTQLVTEQTSG